MAGWFTREQKREMSPVAVAEEKPLVKGFDPTRTLDEDAQIRTTVAEAPIEPPSPPSWEKIKRESVDPGYKTFAEECASVLGYQTLVAKVAKPLAETLAKLEIDVLNTEEVNKYMAETAKIKQQEYDVENPIDPEDRFSSMYRSYFRWSHTPLESSRTKQVMVGNQIGTAPSYSKEIPEFVLNKALQIKKEMPAVYFDVWDMQEYRDPFLSVSFGEYPFSETYFIEVWDEPKFEGRIEKT